MSENKNVNTAVNEVEAVEVQDVVEAKSKTQKKTVVKTKKQPNIKRWFKELKSEMKKVVWPTKKQVLNNTAVVLVTVFMAIVFIATLDYVFSELLSGNLIKFA